MYVCYIFLTILCYYLSFYVRDLVHCGHNLHWYHRIFWICSKLPLAGDTSFQKTSSFGINYPVYDALYTLHKWRPNGNFGFSLKEVPTPRHLPWDLDLLLLLLLLLLARLRLCWCIKGVFRRQRHTNPLPSPPLAPQVGLDEAQKCGTGDLAPMGGRYNHIVPILDHALCRTWSEGLYGRVEAAQYDVITPPPHNPYCVCINYV